MKKLSVRIGLGIVVCGLLPSLAMAASVTFNFTGVVSEVDPSLFPMFNTAQTLTGSYTFNDAIADSNSNTDTGRYNGTITAVTVNLGTYTATLGSTGSNYIEIRNRDSSGWYSLMLSSSDRYEVRAPLAGPTISGFSPLRFRIELTDPNASVFSNTNLQTTPPSLSSFSTNRARVIFEDRYGIARVSGSLTSLTAVPLPESMVLFAAGLVALVGLGAGNWQKQKISRA